MAVIKWKQNKLVVMAAYHLPSWWRGAVVGKVVFSVQQVTAVLNVVRRCYGDAVSVNVSSPLSFVSQVKTTSRKCKNFLLIWWFLAFLSPFAILLNVRKTHLASVQAVVSPLSPSCSSRLRAGKGHSCSLASGWARMGPSALMGRSPLRWATWQSAKPLESCLL